MSECQSVRGRLGWTEKSGVGHGMADKERLSFSGCVLISHPSGKMREAIKAVV